MKKHTKEAPKKEANNNTDLMLRICVALERLAYLQERELKQAGVL